MSEIPTLSFSSNSFNTNNIIIRTKYDKIILRKESTNHFNLAFIEDEIEGENEIFIELYVTSESRDIEIMIPYTRNTIIGLFISVSSKEVGNISILYMEEMKSLPAIHIRSKDYVRLYFEEVKKESKALSQETLMLQNGSIDYDMHDISSNNLADDTFDKAINEIRDMLDNINLNANSKIHIPCIVGDILGIYSKSHLSIDALVTGYKSSEISLAFNYCFIVTLMTNSSEFFFESLPKQRLDIYNSESRFRIKTRWPFESIDEFTWNDGDITHIKIYSSQTVSNNTLKYVYVSKQIVNDAINSIENLAMGNIREYEPSEIDF
jgi:hypothetical protein